MNNIKSFFNLNYLINTEKQKISETDLSTQSFTTYNYTDFVYLKKLKHNLSKVNLLYVSRWIITYIGLSMLLFWSLILISSATTNKITSDILIGTGSFAASVTFSSVFIFIWLNALLDKTVLNKKRHYVSF